MPAQECLAAVRADDRQEAGLFGRGGGSVHGAPQEGRQAQEAAGQILGAEDGRFHALPHAHGPHAQLEQPVRGFPGPE